MEVVAALAIAVLVLTIFFFARSLQPNATFEPPASIFAITGFTEKSPSINAAPMIPLDQSDSSRYPGLLRDYMQLLGRYRELLDSREELRDEFRLYKIEQEKGAATKDTMISILTNEIATLRQARREPAFLLPDFIRTHFGKEDITSKTQGMQTEKVHVRSRTPIPSPRNSQTESPALSFIQRFFTDAIKPTMPDITDPRKNSILPFVTKLSNNGISTEDFKMFDYSSTEALLKMKQVDLLLLWINDCQKYELAIEQVITIADNLRSTISSTTDKFTTLRSSSKANQDQMTDRIERIRKLITSSPNNKKSKQEIDRLFKTSPEDFTLFDYTPSKSRDFE